MAVAAEITLTCAAIRLPAGPLIFTLYSPSARQSVPPVAQGMFAVPWVLNEKRGSKAFDACGWIAGKVYVFAVPAPPLSGVKVMVGVTAVPPRFWTTIVV